MKKILGFLVSVLMLGGVSAAPVGATSGALESSGVEVFAAGAGCVTSKSMIFGLRPWYYGDAVSKDSGGRCEIVTPQGDDAISKFATQIVMNILYDISSVVGYIAVIMVAWGGYLYMFSRGEVGRAEKGKKTLIAAVAGLVIALLANVIINTLTTILTTSTN